MENIKKELENKKYIFIGLNGGQYNITINKRDATFNELSVLLSCLEIVKNEILEHLMSIEREIEIRDNGEENENF